MKDRHNLLIFRKGNSHRLEKSPSVSSSLSLANDLSAQYNDLAETTFDFLHRNHILAEYLHGHELVNLTHKCNKELSKKYPFDIHTKYFYHTCILTTEHLIHIAQRGLSRFRFLKRLELEKHEDAIPFTFNGFYELGEALMKCSSHLTYLNLSGLFMQSTGLQLIFKGFVEDRKDLKLNQIYSRNILFTDKVSTFAYKDTDLVQVGNSSASNSKETSLDSEINAAISLPQNQEYFHRNIDFTNQNKKSGKRICFHKKMSLLSLCHLDLAYNDIGDGKSGLRTLAKLLPLCPSLKYLDLAHNFITCLSNESLKTIVYRCKKLEVFDLRGNLLSENGSRTLFLVENTMEYDTMEEHQNYLDIEETKRNEIEDQEEASHPEFLSDAPLIGGQNGGNSAVVYSNGEAHHSNRVENLPSSPLFASLPGKKYTILSTSSIKRIDLTSNQIKNDNFIALCEQILHSSKFTNLEYIKVSKNFINLDQNTNPYYDILKEDITFLI